MKKILLLTVFIIISFGFLQAQKPIELSSPNGRINVSLKLSDKIYYDISYDGQVLLNDNYLNLSVGEEILGNIPKLKGQKRNKVDELLTPVFPLKFSTVRNNYNSIVLSFRGDYQVEFRAFDDGIAYRFITDKKGNVRVGNEAFAVNFPNEYLLHMQQPGSFKTSYEENYSHVQSNEWKSSDKMALLPVLIDTKKKYKILICETDLSDYPCMFLQSGGKNGLTSIFPKVPLELGEDGDRSQKILKEADYIAETTGKRSFPWRYFVITENDGQLVENTMSYKLSEKNILDDTSWIKPGQVSWEWWNDAAPYGPDVNFVSGYNLETYKYFIDFASKYGIEYIIMDEGWAKSTYDPYTPNPDVDVHEIIRYGKEKNVGIVLWLTWLVVENHMELFETFSQWGVKGVKIDFMDRSDQWMVNYYERVAKEAAKHKLFVDFHGSFKPAGLEYKYPNILSYEGVRGMEQMQFCTPDNSIYLPFMRNAVGAMDYTPGAMLSMQPELYAGQRPNAASIGTRAYQMALFIIFESGLQMLADNPTLYYRNADCTEFMASVPVLWDETKALIAETGEIAVIAKRKGDKWYIGGMTNNREKERNVEVSLDFLNNSKTYRMTSFVDGINAGRQAMDYRKEEREVKQNDKVNIRMVRNGGFAAVIE